MRRFYLLVFFVFLVLSPNSHAQPAPAKQGPPKTYWMAKLAGAAVGLFAVASIWQLARSARQPK